MQCVDHDNDTDMIEICELDTVTPLTFESHFMSRAEGKKGKV